MKMRLSGLAGEMTQRRRYAQVVMSCQAKAKNKTRGSARVMRHSATRTQHKPSLVMQQAMMTGKARTFYGRPNSAYLDIVSWENPKAV